MSKMVTIKTSDYLVDIDLAKSLLEANGIKCFIANEYIVQANWLYSTAMGGIQLKVNPEDAVMARELLSSKTQTIDTGEQDQESLRKVKNICPKCGSQNTGNRIGTTKWAFLSLLLFVLTWPAIRKDWYCFDCGHSWRKRFKEA